MSRRTNIQRRIEMHVCRIRLIELFQGWRHRVFPCERGLGVTHGEIPVLVPTKQSVLIKHAA